MFDLSKDKPDKVLKRLYENLDQGMQANDKWAGHVKNNLRILACGGDGTVAWIVTAVKCVTHDLHPVNTWTTLLLGQQCFHYGPSCCSSTML